MSGDVEVPHHEAESEPLLNVQEIEDTPVYPIIHSIRRDIIVSNAFICLPLAKNLEVPTSVMSVN